MCDTEADENFLPFSTLITQYSYEAMVRVEMLSGQQFACVPDALTPFGSRCPDNPIVAEDVLRGAQIEDSLSIAGGIAVLVAWVVGIRIAGYFALKLMHTSHKPKTSSWKQKRK